MEEDIKTAIQEELAQIPESFLGLVLALLRAFRINLPVGSQNGFSQPSLSLLQNYADKFRKVFLLLSKKESRMNVEKVYSDNFMSLKFSWVSLEDYRTEIIDKQQKFDFSLLGKNNLTMDSFDQILSEGKTVRLYEEEAIFIIKNLSEQVWSEETAREDAKAELNQVLAQLPEKS